MQFVWLNKAGVASDQGFVVQRVERYAIEYREANRVMRLRGDAMFGNLGNASFGFELDAGWQMAIWQPPFGNVQISQADRDRIIQNIKDAFTFMGGKVEFGNP